MRHNEFSPTFHRTGRIPQEIHLRVDLNSLVDHFIQQEPTNPQHFRTIITALRNYLNGRLYNVPLIDYNIDNPAIVLPSNDEGE